MGSDLTFVRPVNIDETLDFLSGHGNETTLFAGGTDVMIDLRTGVLKPRYLMDISRLPEIKGITMKNGELCVGAGVTLSEIYRSKIIARFAPALQKAAFKFASPQIRNVATIGGNVAHCSPCGDTLPPLIIHEARTTLQSQKGERTVPVEALATGPYRNTIRSDEILTRLILKPAVGRFSDFQKIGRRKELAIARISMAIMAEKDSGDKIRFIRLALGSSTPTPQRLKDVENHLMGQVASERRCWEAGRMLASKMIEISGRRASTLYKEQAVQGLLVRLLYPLWHDEKAL